MAYIPLDPELKSKGKAAADVIGGRLGKSGGALIQFTLLSLMPGANLLSLAPSMFGIFLVIMIVWIFAVFGLAKEFKIKSEAKNQED
jgi:AAA family ATP:ADP antiporter